MDGTSIKSLHIGTSEQASKLEIQVVINPQRKINIII